MRENTSEMTQNMIHSEQRATRPDARIVSKKSLIWRVTHMCLFASLLYSSVTLHSLWRDLSDNHAVSHSLWGQTDNHHAQSRKSAAFIAKQWLTLYTSSQEQAHTLLEDWSELNGIAGIAVYSAQGEKLDSAPEDFSARNTDLANNTVSTAQYNGPSLAIYTVLATNDEKRKVTTAQMATIVTSMQLMGSCITLLLVFYVWRGARRLHRIWSK